MAKFSDRMGITTPLTELQVGSMNDDLRNTLWNFLTDIFENRWQFLLRDLYFSYYKLPVDDLPDDNSGCRDLIKQNFFQCSWYEVYNLIEYILQNVRSETDRTLSQDGFEVLLDWLLEREFSGYSVIKCEIVPIIAKQEVESIREAASESSSLKGVSEHIDKARHLFAKKPDPDYPNSIKESISAVEAICCILTGEKAKGLSKAINKLSKKVHLHPSLKEGFLKLYGYSSREGGIRHADVDGKEVGFAEAKYMLVTCSAFVNFVKDKAGKEGLL